jgi:hypothetical protein
VALLQWRSVPLFNSILFMWLCVHFGVFCFFEWIKNKNSWSFCFFWGAIFGILATEKVELWMIQLTFKKKTNRVQVTTLLLWGFFFFPPEVTIFRQPIRSNTSSISIYNRRNLNFYFYFLLSSMTSSQIWLRHLVEDHQPLLLPHKFEAIIINPLFELKNNNNKEESL